MFGRRTRIAGLVALTAAGLTTGLTTPAVAGSPPTNPAYTLADGVTAPVYSYPDAIRESVWVEDGQDLDRDGRIDRVAADIIRPSEPAAAGQRVPVIMDVSPYYACCGRGNERQKKTYEPDGTPLGFPLFYDNYFVPRGYAVVLVDVAGTNRSTGCFDDVASGKAVVDWLNGRAAGYRSVDGDQRVSADWTTGAVGMVGKSQDGTTANGVAALGVRGLRTIVPIEAVSTFYEQFSPGGVWFGYTQHEGPPGLLNPRAERLCVPYQEEQDRLAGTDGDYNSYYQHLDYARHANRVRASVFAIHGFGDINVAPIHLGRWWAALSANDVPRKLWLSQAGHVDPFDLRRADFVATLHRWLDHWLLDIDNGIMTEPMVSIEHAPGQWADEPTWPPASTHTETLRPSSGATPGIGGLGTTTDHSTETFTDDPDLGRYDWAAEPTEPSTARVLFRTQPLDSDTRLSGTGSLTVTVRSSTPEARIGALLVDYGPATIRDYRSRGMGITTLDTRSCWGVSAPWDSACYLDTAIDTTTVDHEVVSVGFADIGHHATLRHRLPLRADRYYTMTLTLGTLDHVVPAGHRLGLVIGGTDGFVVVAPSQRPTLDVDLAGTSVSIPVASGSLTG